MPQIDCIALATMQRVPFPHASVICLGNFDGVHLAHRELLRSGTALRKKSFPDAATAVFCFRELSSAYFSHGAAAHLSTLADRLHAFYEEGMEYAFLADFPDVRTLSAEAFVKDVLIDICRCRAAVCGFNYRFGKGGKATPEDLEALLGAPVAVQSEICRGEEAVSSTRIRRLLTEGNAEEAAVLLTRPYSFLAPVVHGKALGHKLGTPTLNQNFPAKMLIPRHGVYITSCEIDGVSYRGVSNVGVHPTTDGDLGVNCETYLFDFSGDLYGKEIKTSFFKFLRPEEKFESTDALREQIRADIAAAKAY